MLVALCSSAWLRPRAFKLANYMISKHYFREQCLGDARKAVTKELYGFTDAQLSTSRGVVDKFWGLTPQQALERVNELVDPRLDCLTFWVDRWRKRYLECGLSAVDVVVSDVSTPREASILKGMGAKLWVVTDDSLKMPWGTPLDFDAVITGYAALQAQVDFALQDPSYDTAEEPS